MQVLHAPLSYFISGVGQSDAEYVGAVLFILHNTYIHISYIIQNDQMHAYLYMVLQEGRPHVDRADEEDNQHDRNEDKCDIY